MPLRFKLSLASLFTFVAGCGASINQNSETTDHTHETHNESQFGFLDDNTLGISPSIIEPEEDLINEMKESEHCQIEISVCRNGKKKIGKIVETPETAYGRKRWRPILQLGRERNRRALACRLRAFQFASYCKNQAGEVVMSKYFSSEGKLVAQKTSDNGKQAFITLRGFCAPLGRDQRRHSRDIWGIAAGDPESNLKYANYRFEQWIRWCRARPETTFLEYKVVHNGTTVFHRTNQ